jgi:hypothetical protein
LPYSNGPIEGKQFLVSGIVLLQSVKLVIAVLAGVGALAISVAVPALAAEQDPSAYTRADQAYDAKWDKCEALARERGTPPATKGYGEFMSDCVGK